MNYIKFPKNFLEIPDSLSNYETSKVAILPIPYEKTTTYIKGTANGPRAIIEASRNMELYDEELDKNVYEIGICTLRELKIEEKPELMANIVYENVKKVINENKFLVALGGEHSITPGCVKAFAEKYDNLSILQLDAHADLREDYDGSKFSHACAARRCIEVCKNVVQVGIRSLSYEESIFIKKNKLKTFWAKDIVNNDEWFENAIEELKKDVYITLDLDVFDPSIMPSVGTPEPGGLSWYLTLDFLKYLSERKNIVGFDIVELCPNEKSVSSDFTAAKLIYKLIGYSF